MMPTAVLPYQSSFFEYACFGHGPQTAVCFHGYGEQASSFAFLEKHLGGDYTFIAINLPFHGHTQWKEPAPFTPQHLLLVMEAIFREQGITADRFTLFGYSMGGRVAMTLANELPAKVARLCLVAPDGMKMNFWYWLATQTSIGNALFRFTMKRPGWFMGMVKGAHRLHLINTSIGKFLEYYIGDPVVRQQLYDRWTVMRKFTPHLQRLQEDIHTYHIPVRLLYGKYDRIILAARAAPFVRAAGIHGSITILAAGHQLLQEKYADTIKAMLLS
jgi:pimeloyl-ACP methyl ester carboxylesterase